jgi:hypothetical protein
VLHVVGQHPVEQAFQFLLVIRHSWCGAPRSGAAERLNNGGPAFKERRTLIWSDC